MSKSLRVLLVDDNLESAQALAQILAWSGHHSRLAADADSAIALADEFQPDVVLCELASAGAADVPRELRARTGRAGIVIAAVGGRPRPGERESATASGFDARLVKPLRSAVLESFLDDYGTSFASASER